MTQEIKIEKKASEVIQPQGLEEAREAITAKKDLSGANLAGMTLQDLTAVGAILRKTDLSSSDLSHGLLVNPNFYKANLENAEIHNTILFSGDLVKTDFKNANLSNTALISPNAEEANFEGALMRNVALVSANLKNANFTNAKLNNAWIASSNVTGADFTGADLSGTHGHNTNWSMAKVPPETLPQPLVKVPKWAYPVLIGSILSTLSLIIYSLLKKRKQAE